MKKLILLLFIPLVFGCGKSEEVLGCIDSRAINYNPNATAMKDSCCVVKKYINKKKITIKIDNSKYKNVKYKFIYPSQNDTVLSIKKYSYANQVKYLNNFSGFSPNIYYYKSMDIVVSDTIDISAVSTSSILDPLQSMANRHSIVPEKNVKVIEYIDGYEPTTYFVDFTQNADLIFINPRSYFTYRTKALEYGSGISFNDNSKVRNYNGFLIKINDKIDYWFKDHPNTIAVDKRIKENVFKTNLVRL